MLICIIGSHWKVTGRPLETHWLPTIIAPVAFQCTLVSELQAHWIATGLPLDYHWLRVRDSLPTHYAVPDLDDQNCGVMQMGLFPMNGRFLSDKAHLWTCMGIKTEGVFIVDVGINSFFFHLIETNDMHVCEYRRHKLPGTWLVVTTLIYIRCQQYHCYFYWSVNSLTLNSCKGRPLSISELVTCLTSAFVANGFEGKYGLLLKGLLLMWLVCHLYGHVAKNDFIFYSLWRRP